MSGPLRHPADLHLVCGAGGSRAILGTSGALLVTHHLGITGWRTIGGVSGGSIPSLMLAAGYSPPEIARMVIEIEFNKKLTPRTHLLGMWWAFFLKECAWKRRTKRGVLSSEKLGEFIDAQVPAWPEKYWTVAVSGRVQLLFDATGVYQFANGGPKRRVAAKPPSVGLAIRATCAVPGIIDAVDYKGIKLLDGGLAADGRCPVGVVKEQLGAAPNSIVACDVGEGNLEALRREHWFWRGLRRVVCGPCCDPLPEKPLDASDGVVAIQPDVSSVESLEFNLSADQKWKALMSGFRAAIPVLAATGWAEDGRIRSAQSILAEYDMIRSRSLLPGELAEDTAALLQAHGQY